MGRLKDKAIAKINEYNRTAVDKVPITEPIVSHVKSIIAKLSFIDLQEDFEIQSPRRYFEDLGIEAEKLKNYLHDPATKITRITLSGTKPFQIESDFFLSKILSILKSETAKYEIHGVTRKPGAPDLKKEIRKQCRPMADELRAHGVKDDFLAFLFGFDNLQSFRRAMSPDRT
jgi:hypothetical protein